MQRPLATVVISGLITATLLTLLVLPSLYSVVANAKPPTWPGVKRKLRLGGPGSRPTEKSLVLNG